ncbi:MAG TPA: L,D-transpeptidase family protein [Anaerolineales bacterium]|nr:L,D-transpeptidase family protein [Anaerolineales bacterium]
MWWLSIPSNRPRFYRALALSILIVGSGFFALLLAVYLGLRGFKVILPGIQVGKQDLSFKTTRAAVPLLNEVLDQDYFIAIYSPGWTSVRKPSELGYEIDVEATAQRAFEVGYADGFMGTVLRLAGMAEIRPVAPVVSLNEVIARLGLQGASLEANVVPQEAGFSMNGDQLVVNQGVYGRTLDVETAYQTLATNPVVTLLSGYLPVTFTAVIPAVAEIPADVLAQAETFIAQPIVFKAYDPIANTFVEWPVPRETLAKTIRLQIQGGQVTFVTDAVPLRDEISTFSSSLGPDRWLNMEGADETVNAALRGEAVAIFPVLYAPTSYTVQQGDTLLVISWRQGIPLWRILQANPGMDPDNLTAGTTLLIPAKTDLLDLPIVFGKRILVSLSEQHLWAFEGDELVRSEVISTGIDRSPTQPGIFQVRSHVENAYASVWDLYMPNFLGIYEAWPGFENGFHGLPLLSGGRVLWRGTLGTPVSYGCIILDTSASQWLYAWAEEGVIVEIKE